MAGRRPVIAVADTRFGQLGVESDGAHIVALHWNAAPQGEGSPLLAEAVAQLEAYDAGRLQAFDLPLAPKGTAFQQRVFAALLEIPFGETLTYGEMAASLDCAAQPVGQACGANPIPVIIPCHRVLAKSGIGGFSGWGGVESKIALLQHEGGYPFLL